MKAAASTNPAGAFAATAGSSLASCVSPAGRASFSWNMEMKPAARAMAMFATTAVESVPLLPRVGSSQNVLSAAPVTAPAMLIP